MSFAACLIPSLRLPPPSLVNLVFVTQRKIIFGADVCSALDHFAPSYPVHITHALTVMRSSANAARSLLTKPHSKTRVFWIVAFAVLVCLLGMIFLPVEYLLFAQVVGQYFNNRWNENGSAVLIGILPHLYVFMVAASQVCHVIGKSFSNVSRASNAHPSIDSVYDLIDTCRHLFFLSAFKITKKSFLESPVSKLRNFSHSSSVARNFLKYKTNEDGLRPAPSRLPPRVGLFISRLLAHIDRNLDTYIHYLIEDNHSTQRRVILFGGLCGISPIAFATPSAFACWQFPIQKKEKGRTHHESRPSLNRRGISFDFVFRVVQAASVILFGRKSCGYQLVNHAPVACQHDYAEGVYPELDTVEAHLSRTLLVCFDCDECVHFLVPFLFGLYDYSITEIKQTSIILKY